MRSKRLHLFQRRPLFLVCFVFGCALMVFYFHYEINGKMSYQFLADDLASNFLIDTPGCQIPSWDPWDNSVKDLFKKVITPYHCPGQPSFLRTLPNGIVTVEDALLQYYYEVEPENVSCVYQEIRRTNVVDEDVDTEVYLESSQKIPFDQPLEVDFVKTLCKFGDSSQEFVDFLPLTPLKADVERKCVKKNSKIKSQKPLNVIFLGLDSVSHLNFIRHFPKCSKYLSDHLSAITLHGYNKVGDNTFPNIVPLLTGHFYQYYYDEVRNKSMFFDDVDFSWKSFAELGYRTLLAEDAPAIATFNYFRNGFKNPPTDYYYRPFAIAVETSEFRKKSKNQCFGTKMEMDVIYDYLKSFTDTMGQNRLFFAFVFLARLTHDVFNNAGYADEPTYNLLKFLDESNVLNNTMLVFYSDHGIRYGQIRKTRIGQYEERMPFMRLVLPKWFLHEHEDIRKNLEINSKRLTSPFDIHATTLHLASLMSRNAKQYTETKPGRSLFLEIPANRTCSEAGVSPHWCTCQVSQPISKDESSVQRVAKAVIKTLNDWTRVYNTKCATLFLDEVLDARVTFDARSSESNTTHQTGTSSHTYIHYLIVISTSPSKAIFESTVRCDVDELEECTVLDDISRINEYGTQSDCITDTVLKKFCFCL